MNVRELIELLSDFAPDAEVRFATQPSYPLQHHVGRVVSIETGDGDIDPHIVYITEASTIPEDGPYAPSAVFEG